MNRHRQIWDVDFGLALLWVLRIARGLGFVLRFFAVGSWVLVVRCLRIFIELPATDLEFIDFPVQLG